MSMSLCMFPPQLVLSCSCMEPMNESLGDILIHNFINNPSFYAWPKLARHPLVSVHDPIIMSHRRRCHHRRRHRLNWSHRHRRRHHHHYLHDVACEELPICLHRPLRDVH